MKIAPKRHCLRILIYNELALQHRLCRISTCLNMSQLKSFDKELQWEGTTCWKTKEEGAKQGPSSGPISLQWISLDDPTQQPIFSPLLNNLLLFVCSATTTVVQRACFVRNCYHLTFVSSFSGPFLSNDSHSLTMKRNVLQMYKTSRED